MTKIMNFFADFDKYLAQSLMSNGLVVVAIDQISLKRSDLLISVEFDRFRSSLLVIGKGENRESSLLLRGSIARMLEAIG